MAAGLATMVASMSRAKKAYLEHAPKLGEAIGRLTELREELTAAIDADAEAYDGVVKAYREAKASAGAEGLVKAALERATRVPWEVAQRALEVAEIAESLGPITNPNMRSDLTTAVALAKAGVAGARANVEINLESLKDSPFTAELRQKLAALGG
jgi:formiminotetrahydrofolate cyclodeaminase